MPTVPARFALAVVVLLLAFGGTACETPPEVQMNQPLLQGTVQATVTGYSVEYLDLETARGSARSESPFLMIELQVTNQGGAALAYDLGWNTPSATQAQAPLLFVHRAEKVADSIVPANNVRAVQLGEYEYLGDPVTSPTSVGPGETLTDVLLFEVPPEGTNKLVLSLPPTLFGGEVDMPGYILIDYAAPDLDATPPTVALGEPYAGNGFQATVTGTSTEYVRINHAAQGDGFSAQPLFRINLSVQNTSETTIQYMPPTVTGNVDMPTLIDAGGTPIPMAQFEGSAQVQGRVNQARQLSPGESLEDFFLFTQPAQGTTGLQLVIPGRRLGGNGLMRVSVPYTFQTVPEPPELTLPEPEPPTPEEE